MSSPINKFSNINLEHLNRLNAVLASKASDINVDEALTMIDQAISSLKNTKRQSPQSAVFSVGGKTIDLQTHREMRAQLDSKKVGVADKKSVRGMALTCSMGAYSVVGSEAKKKPAIKQVFFVSSIVC